MMHHWRVTKYDPALRDEYGRYMLPEWTAISDVGTTYSGRTFTTEEYLATETSYVASVLSFAGESGIAGFTAVGVENRNESESARAGLPTDFAASIREGGEYDVGVLETLVRLSLRELMWCKVEVGDRFYLHFGYDYYMYIGSSSECRESIRLAERSGLFVEPFVSPYLDED